MKNYFNSCKTVDDARALYRDLMQQHHPDHGGDTETAKDINESLHLWLSAGMRDAFHARHEATGFTYAEADPSYFAEILARIIRLHDIGCVEVIGTWIYCFNSYAARTDLAGLGLWFSSKHKSWVYSGTTKRRIRSRLTIDEVRALHGSTAIDLEHDLEITA